MKKTLLIVTTFLGFATMASASSVYSPDKGIICDKKAHFCVDSYGISLAYTKEYLGQKALDRFNKVTDNQKDMDLTSFTFSNGLDCDTKKKICKKSKWDDNADKHWTNILFAK
ncbi:MAG: hypothetical protein HF962_06970 [Sulfurovum sp.]|nr:hypothetical protein [Sulfurovum sp.]